MKILHSALLLVSLCINCDAGETFASPKYRFIAQFPAEPEATDLKSAMGENLAVSAGVAEEEPPKILFYQILVGQVAAMKGMPEFSNDENLKLSNKNLEAFLTDGKCTDIKIWESKTSSWPSVEFSCAQEGLFRPGFVSRKRGFAFLIKDTY